MRILNHEEIEEAKKMEGDLVCRLVVILCSKDSDIVTESAEVVTKHGLTEEGNELLSKFTMCSIANVLLHIPIYLPSHI